MKFNGTIIYAKQLASLRLCRMELLLQQVDNNTATNLLCKSADKRCNIPNDIARWTFLLEPGRRTLLSKCLIKHTPVISEYYDKRRIVQAIKRMSANQIVMAYALKETVEKQYPGLDTLLDLVTTTLEENDDI